MRTKRLINAKTGEVAGAVIVEDDGTRRMEGWAESILGRVVAELGPASTVDLVMETGWSNQNLYFGDVVTS